MKQIIYSVRDEKMQNYLSPFVSDGVVPALRSLTLAVNNPDSMFSKFPEDYSLYEIGSFDSATGRLSSHDIPDHVASLTSLIKHKDSK